MPVVIGTGSRAELLIFLFQRRIIVAQRNHRGRSNRNRIRAKRQRLGRIGTAANTAGNDQLHLAVHVEILQRLHGRPDAG